MLLHVKHASSRFLEVIIHTPDTDCTCSWFYFKILRDTKLAPYQLSSRVKEVDDLSNLLSVGMFAAVRIENYKKILIIGKVLDIKEEQFQIHY